MLECSNSFPFKRKQKRQQRHKNQRRRFHIFYPFEKNFFLFVLLSAILISIQFYGNFQNVRSQTAFKVISPSLNVLITLSLTPTASLFLSLSRFHSLSLSFSPATSDSLPPKPFLPFQLVISPLSPSSSLSMICPLSSPSLFLPLSPSQK